MTLTLQIRDLLKITQVHVVFLMFVSLKRHFEDLVAEFGMLID